MFRILFYSIPLACAECDESLPFSGASSIQVYKYKNKSNFAKHLLENKRTLNPMENSMEILHTTSKGRMLNTIEKFYIYKETKNNSQINDRHPVTPNVIFDTILRENNNRTLKAT
jgi:hypothetical protein